MAFKPQNRSTAVMARRTEAPDSLDYFPTPPWATRALCEYVIGPGGALDLDIKAQSCLEPAAGGGYMVRPLGEYFGRVVGRDIHDYGLGFEVSDFLADGFFAKEETDSFDWIITNPPFTKAAEFAGKAIKTAKKGVALLVRTAFIEGGERYQTLFSQHRPAIVAPFVERVPMVKGVVDPAASSATSYSWFVWGSRSGFSAMNLASIAWIPPCRQRLEKREDYASDKGTKP